MSSIKKIQNKQIIDSVKNGAKLLMQKSNPKYSKNDEYKLTQTKQERKVSLNKINNSQNGQISLSLKRSLNSQQANFIGNSNPWNTRTNKQQYSLQNGQAYQFQNEEQQYKTIKVKNQQILPQLNHSPQKSTTKYGGVDNSDKKSEYYQGQQHNQSLFEKSSNDLNSKAQNSSKIIKPPLKSMINDKNLSSKENLHEINKRESQLPQIPKQNVQTESYYQKQAENLTLNKQNQNKPYFNSEYQQKQNDYAHLDSSKENHIEFRGNDFINNPKTKNATLSANQKFSFSTTPPNNNNNNSSISKQFDDKMLNSKEPKKVPNSQVQNVAKDSLEEKFEKIYDTGKSISISQNNTSLPPKIIKKEIDDKENVKIENKERLAFQEESLNKLQPKIQKSEIINSNNKLTPNENSKLEVQNQNSVDSRQSFQMKNKVEQQQSTNPLIRYYKYDFDFSKFNFTFSKRSSAGLNNIGNTCFMNSALQCVFNTPVFNEFFFSGSFEKDINPKNKGVAQSYSVLIKQVRNTGNSSSQAPYALKKSIERVSSQFYGTDQQDAQELLRCLLDGLHEDLNRVRAKPKYRELEADTNKRTLQEISDDWYQYYKGRDDSVVTDFFSGQLLSKVICSKCKNESLAFDNFMDLSLSFSRGQENEADLVDLLKAFLKEENLDDDYYCSKCKARTKSRRQFELYKLPQILVIHLKRFNFGRSYRNKISSNVSFPVTNFDVQQFIQSSTDNSVKNSKYELFGIVNHSGSLSGGHYTSESLNPYDGKWYNYNDSHAGSISQESINRYQSSGRQSPYLLFYCKSELLIPYQNNINNGVDHHRMKSNL
ncbi:ubiquitin carboxy-terminal hydrolase (macronuclear) [Tetrahymena thermophila SB210]|uniref:Ubiquitin carboxyl-terminal hydrolase n=1 Tax=Tetrahymena thermophila (strain SB210) TaxID=312017 RepID=I7MLV0_TETTS|nr:ubiquitin carboxy-terminal hydrolase [Tetrahymena thermophila SB210]EAS03115.2 ubiquitin carboxy-terminal hydrolase [Tetrahymena thermophila SB210]|eukprot:XP_001023360.2 ubiquitin carboxy-terminal hydrolase [Tetrahymena thermophila SB210]